MKRLLVVGSGQRVREAALPVAWASTAYELAGVVSRKPKELAVRDAAGAERRVEVEPLDGLTRERLAGIDLVYVVVSKGAVPRVLAQLAALDPRNVELLVETPVLLPKHLGHLGLLSRFRAAHVAEDCAFLPCLPAIRACVASGALGGPARAAVLAHSAYAYHGVALAKALLGATRVRAARRRRLGGALATRDYELAGGARAHVLEPRDYGAGRIALAGPERVLADHAAVGEPTLALAALVESGRCTGFRAGDAVERLSAAESALMGTARAGTGVTAWMDGMKRVGLARMLASIAAGEGGYRVLDAVDDALVDYHLEKLGRYRANPLTSARGALRPLAFGALTRLAGR